MDKEITVLGWGLCAEHLVSCGAGKTWPSWAVVPSHLLCVLDVGCKRKELDGKSGLAW